MPLGGVGPGRQVTSVKIGPRTRASVNVIHMRPKVGGVTLNWGTVVAPVSAGTMADGTPYLAGQKFIRYGTFLARVTNGEITTLTESGSPDGGDFTVSVSVDGYPAQTTAAQAFNVSAANLATALTGLSRVGTGNMTVARTGTTTNFVWTVTAVGALLGKDVVITVNTAGLTVGGSPGGAIAVATTAEGEDQGSYGPADSAATDGRQTWTRGAFYLLDETIFEFDSPYGAAYPSSPSQHVGVYEGGVVYAARLNVGGSGQPTLAQVTGNDALLPNLTLHYGNGTGS